jgi:hypothetical protein
MPEVMADFDEIRPRVLPLVVAQTNADASA